MHVGTAREHPCYAGCRITRYGAHLSLDRAGRSALSSVLDEQLHLAICMKAVISQPWDLDFPLSPQANLMLELGKYITQLRVAMDDIAGLGLSSPRTVPTPTGTAREQVGFSLVEQFATHTHAALERAREADDYATQELLTCLTAQAERILSGAARMNTQSRLQTLPLITRKME